MPQGKSVDEYILLMKDRLDLSAEQEAKIRPIIEEEWERRREIIVSYRGERESMRAAMQWLEKDTESQLAAILTQEQMAEYRQLREEMRQSMREKMRGRRPGRF